MQCNQQHIASWHFIFRNSLPSQFHSIRTLMNELEEEMEDMSKEQVTETNSIAL